MLGGINKLSHDIASVVHFGRGDFDDGMFEHAEASKRQRHSSQHQSAKQVARQAARLNKMEEQREEEEKGEQVEKNVTGWTLVTRSAKGIRRMVQIFVNVSTTPQMTCFRGAKVCTKWPQRKVMMN